jgi:hypothetical protein
MMLQPHQQPCCPLQNEYPLAADPTAPPPILFIAFTGERLEWGYSRDANLIVPRAPNEEMDAFLDRIVMWLQRFDKDDGCENSPHFILLSAGDCDRFLGRPQC